MNIRCIRYWLNVIAALVLVLGLMMPTSTPQAQSGGNPGVIPPNARPYGKTYGEWSAKWWQWALSIPASVNPIIDATGADCAQGQSGHVWFLAGNFGGASTRSCTVPTGKAIFFPIVTFENDNFLCFDPDRNLTVAQLRAEAKSVIDGAVNLSCEIDGRPVANLQNYRAISPDVFSLTLPAGNVLQAVGCADAVAGTYTPAVVDAYSLMLAPLSVGSHTIHFHAELPDFGFVLDVTYNLTVAH